MKSFNDRGVSEVVGAMLILMIVVIYIGVIQAYEVPKWNKEIERQAYSEAMRDFLGLRSDIEYSASKDLPITSSMYMGILYPERFMLRNPGPGAYGIISTYPLNINITYYSNGTAFNENYISTGFVYEMRGSSFYPKLVNEHGMVITDFWNWNNSDDVNRLTTENGVFIPYLSGIEPVYSTGSETFDILPVTQSFFTEPVSYLNVTMETRYPEVWASMPPESLPTGSEYSVVDGEIRITNISGFDLRNLSLPVPSTFPEKNIHSGIIRFTDSNTVINTISINMTKNVTNNILNNITNSTVTNVTNIAITNVTNYTSVFLDDSSCSLPGRYIWDERQGCINLPKSAEITNFIIQDIKLVGGVSGADIVFNIRDFRGNHSEAQIFFNSNSTGDPVSITSAAGACNPSLVDGKINLTLCYKEANFDSPNVLKITHFDNQILFVRFIVY